MFIKIFFVIIGCIYLFAIGVICGICLESRKSEKKEKILMYRIQKLIADNYKLQKMVGSLKMDIFKKEAHENEN